MAEEPTKKLPSITLFKLCGTCFVLLVAAFIGLLVAKGMEADLETVLFIGSVIKLLLASVGITLLLGIIVAIWEQ